MSATQQDNDSHDQDNFVNLFDNDCADPEWDGAPVQPDDSDTCGPEREQQRLT